VASGFWFVRVVLPHDSSGLTTSCFRPPHNGGWKLGVDKHTAIVVHYGISGYSRQLWRKRACAVGYGTRELVTTISHEQTATDRYFAYRNNIDNR